MEKIPEYPPHPRETLGEWRAQKIAEGRKYVALSLPELWRLEKAGDAAATEELNHRDREFADLGQG